MRPVALLALLTTFAACEGPTGPARPQDTNSTSGPAVSGTELVFSGTIPYLGSISIDLPAAAGTIADLPIVDCYVSDSHSPPGRWTRAGVSDESSSISSRCRMGENTDGTLWVALNGPIGASYFIVVLY